MNSRVVKIVLGTVLAVGVITYLAVALSLAHKRLNNAICNKLQVVIVDSSVNQFVRKDDIPNIFRANGKTYFGKRLGEISTSELEKALCERSLIKKADVYTTADGTLHVNILQRKPIMRIFTDDGQSFYIDNDGYMVQPYSGYTSYVPVVSGSIKSPFAKDFKNGDMLEYFKKNNISDSLYIQLYKFAKYLSQNSFWQSQVEQVYITQGGKVELIPRVGEQIIRLGSLNNFEYKLKKLITFYEKGMPLKGWNAYDVIDLSYGNQVVCKLK